MANISIANVSKSYGKVAVIHGIDLEIGDGEFVVLVGQSGCGKSTLLRMIAGLEDITSGTISIDGKVINNVAPKDRDIAMVFQNYALYPHMTVAENMGFSLRLRNENKQVIDAAVAKAGNILGLGEYLDRFPRQLSGGQRQRVAMGRAIVRDPEIFLFDEPLSNLDAKLRVNMRTEVKELHLALGATSVFVTHDQIEAMTMADKIIVMDNGHVAQVGSPLEIYDHPVSKFVATFIGSPPMNILQATAGDHDSGTTLQFGDGQSSSIDRKLPPGSQVLFGLRPDGITIAKSETGIKGLVRVIEPTGPESQVVLEVGKTQVYAAMRDRPDIKIGDQVPLNFSSSEYHLFDCQTERAL